MNQSIETITLAGGCFWCLEAVYEQVRGVTQVESGYGNGLAEKPTYEQVCTGRTGHAEVVRVSFDSARLSLRQVLEIFFVIHDPTTLNRQGDDKGTQYRSGIYFHDAEQERVAREVLNEANQHHQGKVVTEITPQANYWRAEDEHQHYFANHPGQGYCAFVVSPKVEKFRRTFKSLALAPT
ncbi:MAG: peptide-methionine (S)-S-oxide reductase MsrA [Burkholderiales bacterium]|nr:peptide-methionine (S)-S-oxide reductase MsrA [Burkholderiales bacterium]